MNHRLHSSSFLFFPPITQLGLNILSVAGIYLAALFILFRENFVKDADVIRSLIVNKA